VRAEGPGKCPICAMTLIPVYEQGEGGGSASDSGPVKIKLTPREVQLSDIRTDVVAFRSLNKNIRAVGKVMYDERKLAHVAAWVPGRVDRLFVNFTGAVVKKGQPLLEIYSPDLVTTQEEYLLSLETLDKVANSRIPETVYGARSLVQASRKRLLLWGISEQQIEKLEQDRKAQTHMTLYAPMGGVVTQKMVKEGMYVKEGQVFFDIADLSAVWVMADIYESELSWIENGQMAAVSVEAYPGETFMGRITFIDPVLNTKTRSVGVRIEAPNEKHLLKPGMFADVNVRVPTGRILAVPKAAILDTGPRKVAYLDQGEGQFVGVEVKIGREAEGFFPVLSGLSEGDRVVTAANFLIDSQTQLFSGSSALYGGAKEIKEGEAPPPASGHQH
ncbi:MAG: efflux RND transporter periplasmic adaptor subunit, partial [Candidatus Latescibacterota bacterium]